MINKSEVIFIAELSVIEISNEELLTVTSDLNKILEYFNKISSIKVSKENMGSIVENKVTIDEIRKDVTLRQSESDSESIMKSAPVFIDNYFVVPKVM